MTTQTYPDDCGSPFPQPTACQRFVASGWPLFLWNVVGTGSAVVWVVCRMELEPAHLLHPAISLLLVVAAGLAFLAGAVASLLTAWFFLGPLYYAQGLANGGPFAPGDLVLVLAGKHRGRVAKVYAAWQHESVRIDLGPEEKAEYQDIFVAHQLLRMR